MLKQNFFIKKTCIASKYFNDFIEAHMECFCWTQKKMILVCHQMQYSRNQYAVRLLKKKHWMLDRPIISRRDCKSLVLEVNKILLQYG